MPLELQLFGVPELRLDGRRIQLTRKSSWAMLAYLALSGVPHAREVLTGLFGGNGTEDQARRRISNALAEMRHEIGPCLLTSWSVVGFRPEVTCASDVQRFEMYLRQAREQDDATALRAAADLYRGEFLAGLSLKCSPDFEMWLLLQRESYHAQFVVAAEELIASAGRRSAWIDGEWAARRLLELEPWHEEAHRQLMLLLARSGQRRAALAQFDICKRVLREELDTAPDEQTVEVYEELKRDCVVPNNLLAQTTEFVGRDAEATLLTRQLGDVESRLITIAGPPGSGKTRLAIEVASAAMRTKRSGKSTRFADGVFVVSTGPRFTQSLPVAVARALGLDDAGGMLSAAELADRLAPHSMLLVLDELDHSPFTTELVSALLSRGPRLTLLVTAVAPLRVDGEHVLTIDGLDLPSRPEDLERSAAGALLVAEARRANLRFEVAPDARASLVQLCRLLYGLPLGLILAARVLSEKSSADLVRALEAALTPESPGNSRPEPGCISPRWLSVMDTLELLQQAGGVERNGAMARTGAYAGRGASPFALVCTPDADAGGQVTRLREEGMIVCVTSDVTGSLRVATSVGPHVVLIDPRLPRRLEQLLRAHPVSSRASIRWMGEAVTTQSGARGEAVVAGA